MNTHIYINTILTACYTFPIIAALFTVPYVIHQYHKYGALLMFRVVIIYTFIFYMMTSFFMTVLPLPPIDSVTHSSATMLLKPFDALHRWIESSGFIISDPSTYKSAFTDYELWQIIFNILLLVPFGVYLRYYFNRKWYQVLILSFLYSLFFELTQLSALYGIYPYPYRFFDVDDLICNTLGGMLGFIITPALSFFLPSREKLDTISYKKGTHVSPLRRFCAVLIDFAIILGLYIVLDHFISLRKYLHEDLGFLILPLFAFTYFTLSQIILRGYTVGKFCVNIRIVSENGKRPKFYQYITRNFLVYMLIVPNVIYIFYLINLLNSPIQKWKSIVCSVILPLLIVLLVYSVFNMLKCFISHNSQFMYDKLCRLKTISTVKTKQSKNRL